MSDKTVQESASMKKSKPRSRLYPRYSLEDVVEFIKALSKLGGENVSQEALAAELGKGVNNSTFSGRVSSAKQFGLIAHEGGKLSLTVSARQILFPREGEEKNLTLRNAFTMPPLYRELIDAFKGKMLPEITALGNRLHHDYGIEVSAKDLAARNFMRSAQFAGVVQNGILILESRERELTGVQEAAEKPEIISRQASSGENFVFEFEGGIKLTIPKNERTSTAIADGELKPVRQALKEFSRSFVQNESLGDEQTPMPSPFNA